MRRTSTVIAPGETPDVLIRAAERGARVAVGLRRAEGLDDETIRHRVVVGFRQRFQDVDCGEFQRETLMAAVQRGVEAALG